MYITCICWLLAYRHCLRTASLFTLLVIVIIMRVKCILSSPTLCEKFSRESNYEANYHIAYLSFCLVLLLIHYEIHLSFLSNPNISLTLFIALSMFILIFYHCFYNPFRHCTGHRSTYPLNLVLISSNNSKMYQPWKPAVMLRLTHSEFQTRDLNIGFLLQRNAC